LLAISRTPVLIIVYLINFLQYQRTDLSILIFDIYLVKLISVYNNGANFLNGILVIYLIKEIVDPPCRGLFERII